MAALSDSERLDWLRLARTQSVGPVTFAGLLQRYRTPKAALAALPELSKKAGRAKPVSPPPVAAIEAEIEALTRYGARVVAACEPDFPPGLAALNPPPPVLTVMGDLALAARPCLAIVGARNASAAGRKIARDMATELGRAGWVIVSGLARGIDGEAHAAALATGTAAVLGGGIDHVYPPEHDDLYSAIAAQGLIVSECPFGYRAGARDFPRRNRFISGMSRSVVVVEASERSGSLVTARMAGEQGREVMAIPGSPLDPRAAGTNRLIRQGAALVTNAADVLECLGGLSLQGSFRAPQGDEFEADPDRDMPQPGQVAAVREALSPSPMPIDEIARAAGISIARCRAILMELELAGVAVTLPGGLAALSFE